MSSEGISSLQLALVDQALTEKLDVSHCHAHSEDATTDHPGKNSRLCRHMLQVSFKHRQSALDFQVSRCVRKVGVAYQAFLRFCHAIRL